MSEQKLLTSAEVADSLGYEEELVHLLGIYRWLLPEKTVIDGDEHSECFWLEEDIKSVKEFTENFLYEFLVHALAMENCPYDRLSLEEKFSKLRKLSGNEV